MEGLQAEAGVGRSAVEEGLNSSRCYLGDGGGASWEAGCSTLGVGPVCSDRGRCWRHFAKAARKAFFNSSDIVTTHIL